MKRKPFFNGGSALLLIGTLVLPGSVRAAAPAGPGDAELPPDTQALLQRLPENARLVLTVDIGSDNPNMKYAKPKNPSGSVERMDRESMEVLTRDLREGVSRILRLF